jgi:hypothetical protein
MSMDKIANFAGQWYFDWEISEDDLLVVKPKSERDLLWNIPADYFVWPTAGRYQAKVRIPIEETAKISRVNSNPGVIVSDPIWLTVDDSFVTDIDVPVDCGSKLNDSSSVFSVQENTVFRNGAAFASLHLLKDFTSNNTFHIAGALLQYHQSNEGAWVFPRKGKGLCAATKVSNSSDVENVVREWQSNGPCFSKKLRKEASKVEISPDGKGVLVWSSSSKTPLRFDLIHRRLK